MDFIDEVAQQNDMMFENLSAGQYQITRPQQICSGVWENSPTNYKHTSGRWYGTFFISGYLRNDSSQRTIFQEQTRLFKSRIVSVRLLLKTPAYLEKFYNVKGTVCGWFLKPLRFWGWFVPLGIPTHKDPYPLLTTVTDLQVCNPEVRISYTTDMQFHTWLMNIGSIYTRISPKITMFHEIVSWVILYRECIPHSWDAATNCFAHGTLPKINHEAAGEFPPMDGCSFPKLHLVRSWQDMPWMDYPRIFPSNLCHCPHCPHMPMLRVHSIRWPEGRRLMRGSLLGVRPISKMRLLRHWKATKGSKAPKPSEQWATWPWWQQRPPRYLFQKPDLPDRCIA